MVNNKGMCGSIAKMEMLGLCFTGLQYVCWALPLHGDNWEAAPRGKEKDGVWLWRWNCRGLWWEMIEEMWYKRGERICRQTGLYSSPPKSPLIRIKYMVLSFLISLAVINSAAFTGYITEEEKNTSGSLPTARCSLLFDMGVIIGSFTPAGVARCFNLILAKNSFTGH